MPSPDHSGTDLTVPIRVVLASVTLRVPVTGDSHELEEIA